MPRNPSARTTTDPALPAADFAEASRLDSANHRPRKRLRMETG